MVYYLNNPEKEKNFGDLDCLYLHMLFPIKEQNNDYNINDNLNINNGYGNLDSYYEVGCKIFEINKIIR